jgi:hypothetical protein
VPLWLLSLLLGRGGIGGGSEGSLGGWRQLLKIGGHHHDDDPCLQPGGAWTVWEDWRRCRQRAQQEEEGGEEPGGGGGWLARAPRHWEGPAASASASAVLVELERAAPRALGHAIRNALENLPVAWRVQVVAGSEEVAAAARALFAEEAAVGKVVVTRVGAGGEEGRGGDSKVGVGVKGEGGRWEREVGGLVAGCK